MSVHFNKLAIIGLGLLGASVARAARRAGVVDRIAAASRRRGPMETALAEGVVDEIGACEAVVREADLVVLCSPIGSMPALVEAAAPGLRSGTLVTDVGSVKGALADRLPGILPEGVEYIGAHPMAGSHERGAGYARENLFDGAACVLTPTVDTTAQGLSKVCGFWEALGARVLTRIGRSLCQKEGARKYKHFGGQTRVGWGASAHPRLAEGWGGGFGGST